MTLSFITISSVIPSTPFVDREVFFYLDCSRTLWLIDWLTDWLTVWLSDWLTAGWLADGLTDWLTDWLSCDCRLCVHNYWYYHNSHSQCYYWCRFGDAGCYTLCDGLRRSRKLTSLSLNYCKLGPTSGTVLGYLVSTTAIMYVLTHPADVPEPSCFRVFCLSLHVCIQSNLLKWITLGPDFWVST